MFCSYGAYQEDILEIGCLFCLRGEDGYKINKTDATFFKRKEEIMKKVLKYIGIFLLGFLTYVFIIGPLVH